MSCVCVSDYINLSVTVCCDYNKSQSYIAVVAVIDRNLYIIIIIIIIIQNLYSAQIQASSSQSAYNS